MARSRGREIVITSGTALALVGAIVGIAPLFWRGWVHLHFTFAAQDTSGAPVFRRLGIDVDRPIAAITEREINRAVPPTLWQVQGHPFPIIAALFLLAALFTTFAMFVRRGARLAQGAALFASVVAAAVTIVAFIRIHARFDALPDTINAALRASGALGQAVGYSTGRPQMATSVAWPLIAVGAGAGAILIGTALVFVVSLPVPRSPAILRRFRERERRAKETMHGDTGRPPSIRHD